MIWTYASSSPARITGPALAPLTTPAALRAAAATERTKAGSRAAPGLPWATSVNEPEWSSLMRSSIRSAPFWASEPGTEKRFVSRSPSPADAAPPSTSAISQASSTFLRCRTMKRVQRATAKL